MHSRSSGLPHYSTLVARGVSDGTLVARGVSGSTLVARGVSDGSDVVRGSVSYDSVLVKRCE